MLGFKRARKATPGDAVPEGRERIALCERCEFEVSGSGNLREGVCWNLSVVGLYLVVHAEIPPVKTAVDVRLWFPGDPRPLRAGAEVVWCNLPSPLRGCGATALRFPPGCGLRFVDIAPEDVARIESRVQTTHPHRGGPTHQR